MWLKLFLLCLYLIILFVLSRLLEVSSWYSGSAAFLNSRTLLDPFALSVKKLKQLLDNRGVTYSGVVEKAQLIDLVEASGAPADDELSQVDDSSAPNHQTTQFTCGSHFYEEVTDAKDSIWLVHVTTSDGAHLLDNQTWGDVVSKVSRFGVRTGVFHCALDKRLCAGKMWTSPRLILALPRGNKAKQDVVLHSFIRSSKSSAVLKWVQTHLTSKLKQLHSKAKMKDFIENDNSASSELKLILFSQLAIPPLLLSSLAVKFTGRVKFAVVHVNEENKKSFKDYLVHSTLPVYLVITPEKNFYYGSRKGENLTFKDMDLFLKSLRPEMNDIFLWSLLLINSIAGFELFLVYRQVWKHFIHCFLIFFKYNCILLLSWLLILTLNRFPFMNVVTELSLKYVRFISGTNFAAVIRDDWGRHYSWSFLLLMYFGLGGIVGFMLKKLRYITTEEDIPLFSDWWEASWSSSLVSYFFRPMTSRSASAAFQDIALEDGMELLIERLAVPNLWLQPMISTDYIKDLPVWMYHGWCEADDIANDSKSDLSSSEDESVNMPSCFPVPDSKVETAGPEELLCDNPQVVKFAVSENELSSQKCKSTKCLCSSQCNYFHISINSGKLRKCGTCVHNCSSHNGLPQNDELSSTFSKKPELTRIERAPIGMLEFRECSICLESYHYGAVLCGLPCGHNYHIHCITSWLYRDNHCCPICRWPSYKSKSQSLHFHNQ